MLDPGANMDVEIVAVDPNAVMDLTCSSPWQAVSESAAVLRMCLQEGQDAHSDVADYPDGITVSSNTGYPFAATRREAASPCYYFTLADNTADLFDSASLPPTYAVQTEYAVDTVGSTGSAATQPSECLSCRRTYSSGKALTRHYRQMHGPRVWHVCDVCGKPLASASSLRSHQWLHTGRRPFQCPLCTSGFVRRPYLRAHMLRVHSLHANLAVKLEELDHGEGAARRAEDREEEDGLLQDAQVVHVQSGEHHHHEGLHLDAQDDVTEDQVAPVPDLEFVLVNGHHQDGPQQEVLHQVGRDSGSIVIVKSDLDADGCDSGVSSVSTSPSSSWQASPASSATSEEAVDAPILVRLVRDGATGLWKIDLGQC